MSKKLDFYNGKGDSREIDYSSETYRRVGNRKTGLFIALVIAFLTDVLVTVLVGTITKDVRYFLAPAALALVDALFAADLFFINLKQKYTRGHRVLYILLSLVLAMVTVMIPSMDKDRRVMTVVAVFLTLGMQVVKVLFVLFLYHIDKKSLFTLRDRIVSAVLILILTGALAAYSLWNLNVGLMGQHVAYTDQNCTLVYSLGENGEYEVVDCFHDGNVLSIPSTFDGKPVTAVDCSFIDSSIKKIVISSAQFTFRNTDKTKSLNDAITVNVYKDNIDSIRLGLFKDCWTSTGEATNAKTLFDSVVPGDLAPDQSYYNVSCTDAFTSKTVGYIPTIFKSDGAEVTLRDLQEKLDPVRKQLFDRTDIRDQGDLKYCFENNNKMILSKGEVVDNDFLLTLERVYKFMLGKGVGSYGNDEKWIPSMTIREKYSVSSGLIDYYRGLPAREGFSVVWNATPSTRTTHLVTSEEDFFEYIVGLNDGFTIDMRPEWAILPPTIEQVPSENVTIIYGENADLSIRTKCVFPVKYTLKTAAGTPISDSELTMGEDWSYKMENKLPSDSGVYTLVMKAHPSAEITSLSYSAPTEQSYTFTVNKKTLHLDWGWDALLPSSLDRVFDNQTHILSLAYVGEDRVGTDVIELSKTMSEVKNSGKYNVTASMDAESQKKYVFLSEGEKSAERSFTIEKKSIVVDWKVSASSEPSLEETFLYVYNGAIQCPIATTTVFGETETLEVSTGYIDAGTYSVTAMAREVGSNANGVYIDTDNYKISQNENKRFTIDKKTVENVTWGTDVFTYNGGNHQIAIVSMTGYIEGEESIAFGSILYSNNEKKNKGNYTATATYPDVSNYRFGLGENAIVSHVLQINPKEIGYSWTDTVFSYNKAIQHPIATANLEDLCGGDSCEFAYSGGKQNAGTYENDVSLTGVTNPNYTLAGGTHFCPSYTITPIFRTDLAIIYPDRTYGEEAPIPSVTGNEEEGEVTYEYKQSDNSYSTTVPKHAGTYAIRATTGATTNYYETIRESSFVIRQKVVTLAWSIDNLVYSASAKVASAEVANALSGDTVAVTVALTNGKDNVNVGTFTFTANALIGVDKDDYTLSGATTVSPSYTITPYEITIAWQELSLEALVYDKTAKTVTASPVGLLAEDSCLVSTARYSGDNVNVGSPFRFRATLGNPNYTLSDANALSASYAITPRPITVAVRNDSVVYGAQKPNFDLDIVGMISGDSLTGKTVYVTSYDPNDPEHRGVDSYEVMVSGVSHPNYTFTPAAGTLTVTQRVISLAWSFTSVVYDGLPHLPTATMANRAYEADQISFVYNTSESECNVGNYSRTVIGITGEQSSNYTHEGGENLVRNWSITAKNITVKVKNESIVYGSEKPSFDVEIVGLVGGDTLNGEAAYLTDYDRNNILKRSVGEYDITVNGFSHPNYNITVEKGTLAVTQLPIELSWDKDSFVYDGLPHLPTATVVNRAFILDSVSLIYDTSVKGVNVDNYTSSVTGINSNSGNNYTTVGGKNLSLDWSITPASRGTIAVEMADRSVENATMPPVITSVIEESTETTIDYLYGVYGSSADPSEVMPTEVGNYYVIVCLSASTNYAAAQSLPCQYKIYEE